MISNDILAKFIKTYFRVALMARDRYVSVTVVVTVAVASVTVTVFVVVITTGVTGTTAKPLSELAASV